jgi:hypothetical protein
MLALAAWASNLLRYWANQNNSVTRLQELLAEKEELSE